MENTLPLYKLLMLCLVASTILTSAMAQTEANKLDSLQSRIKKRLSLVEGRFALAFKSLENLDHALYFHEKALFHAASLMKVPVMVEVFNQVKSGRFSLSDSVMINNEFKSIVDGSPYKLDLADDGGEAMYGYIGRKRTVLALVHEMITVSSNLATNVLIEKIGTASIANTLTSIGAKDMRVLRGVEDKKAFDKGWNNTVTAYDLMVIYERMGRNELISQAASREMVEILLGQQFNSILPSKLPVDAKVAHKTGEITGVQHDSGIIFMPNGRRYVLVLLSDGLKNREQGALAMADISEMIYLYMAGEKR